MNPFSIQKWSRTSPTGNLGFVSKRHEGCQMYGTYLPLKWIDAVDFLRLSDNPTSPANVAFGDTKDCKVDCPFSFYNKALEG